MRPPLVSLCQATAVSVATILGTGILGLPVSLYASGFRPFLLTFTLNLFAQLGVVVAAVELLQRAHVASAPALFPPVSAQQSAPYAPVAADDVSAVVPPAHPCAAPPSLHALAAQFLPYAPLRALFNGIVVVHFLFILSAYALAGPQALAALAPVLRAWPAWALPTAFVGALAALVVGAPRALLAPLAVGTAGKAVLLSVIVGVIFVRGLGIRETVADNWGLGVLVDPFLMGTFALNGVVNLMPVTFQACLDGATKMGEGGRDPVDRDFVRAYRLATVVAVVVCYVLNVAWCFAVLMCVPQASAVRTVMLQENALLLPGARASASSVGLFSRFQRELEPLPGTATDATLAAANELGQISTIPLMQILQSRGDKADVVIAFLVNLFIGMSITVSFLVMSVGMKHYIDGEAMNQPSRFSWVSYDVNRRVKYALAFSLVLVIAVGDPTALIKITEGITALSLNMESGAFILYMLHVGRQMTKDIPAPLSSVHVLILVSFVGLYFLTAVFVDIVFYIPKTIS